MYTRDVLKETMTLVLRPHQKRALDVMLQEDKGQIIVPTGGGKTFIMIQHALAQFRASDENTVVVVAPRILLAHQLCSEFMQFLGDEHINPLLNVLHVHSGRSKHKSTTKADKIKEWHDSTPLNKIIFTTYHSLHRVIDSGIAVSCAYFDEAHNSTKRCFFGATADISEHSSKTYFFTATPRISTSHLRGMNNEVVYGTVLETVPAQELIASGSILPPKVVPFETSMHFTREKQHVHHSQTIQDVLDSLDETQAAKVLVSVPSSRVLGDIVSRTTVLSEMKKRGYDVLHITSRFGAYVNDKKVKRTEFFNTLTEWGKSARKFVIFHYSILSEGINVPGLTHCILLRNLNVVEMAQTIGRVIRLHTDDSTAIRNGELQAGCFAMYTKPCGYVTIPVHEKYGSHIIKRLQTVVDAIFVKGVPPLALS